MSDVVSAESASHPTCAVPLIVGAPVAALLGMAATATVAVARHASPGFPRRR